jgi:hypothetical protein
MKHLTPILFFLAISASHIYGQSSDSISMSKTFWGYQFEQGGKRLSKLELKSAIVFNRESHQLYKKARTNNLIALVLGGYGGYMAGYTLGVYVAGGEPNLLYGGIGAGLIAASMVLDQRTYLLYEQSIEAFNKDLPAAPSGDSSKLFFNISGLGAGFTLVF